MTGSIIKMHVYSTNIYLYSSEFARFKRFNNFCGWKLKMNRISDEFIEILRFGGLLRKRMNSQNSYENGWDPWPDITMVCKSIIKHIFNCKCLYLTTWRLSRQWYEPQGITTHQLIFNRCWIKATSKNVRKYRFLFFFIYFFCILVTVTCFKHVLYQHWCFVCGFFNYTQFQLYIYIYIYTCIITKPTKHLTMSAKNCATSFI